MAFNQIQFQHGMSIPEFLRSFGTEAQCAEAIKAARWPEGFRCPRCSSSDHYVVGHGARKLFQCNGCRHQTSLTAGSLMAHTKLPLTTWFLAIYLISQAKTGLSALALKRQLGVSYPTACALPASTSWRATSSPAWRMIEALKAVDDLQAHHERRAMAELGRSLNVQVIAELDRLARNANIRTPKLRFDFAEIKPSELQRPATLDGKALDALKAKVRQVTLVGYLTYTRLDGTVIQLTGTLVRLSNGQSQSFMVTAPVSTAADVLARVWFDYFYGNRFPQHSNPMTDKEWLTAAPGHIGKLVSREAAERYCQSQKASLPNLEQMELGEAAGFHHGGVSLEADSMYHIQDGLYYSSETSHVDGRLRKNFLHSISNGYYYCIRPKAANINMSKRRP